jgi:hypothetical protein
MIKRLSNIASTHKIVNYSFLSGLTAEENILTGHSLMMTPGMHHILVHDVVAGRALLTKLLKSLGFYRSIAYLSLEHYDHSYEYQIDDLYTILLSSGYLMSNSSKSIQDFLYESCEYDFIWIELTANLKNQTWYTYFYEGLKAGRSKIPVFVLNYNRQ